MAQASPLASLGALRGRGSALSPCDSFDRPDAPPFGWRRVLTQACHDLYGTKDVQDAITASYVWMADQIGHLTLGLVPTLLLCWILYLVLSAMGIGAHWWEFAIIAGAIFAYWPPLRAPTRNHPLYPVRIFRDHAQPYPIHATLPCARRKAAQQPTSM